MQPVRALREALRTAVSAVISSSPWDVDLEAARTTSTRQAAPKAAADGVEDQAALIDALHDAERRRAEIFAACQNFEKQRDEWITLYKQNTMGHGAAQALLERRIAQIEAQRDACFRALNLERKAAGKEPTTMSAVATSDIYGKADEFLQQHLRLFEEARSRFGLPPIERPAAKPPCTACSGTGKAQASESPDASKNSAVWICVKCRCELFPDGVEIKTIGVGCGKYLCTWCSESFSGDGVSLISSNLLAVAAGKLSAQSRGVSWTKPCQS